MSTLIPAARNASTPLPETKGLESKFATYTFATPDFIMASTQGGVRQKCAQGSKLTYSVAPLNPFCLLDLVYILPHVDHQQTNVYRFQRFDDLLTTTDAT